MFWIKVEGGQTCTSACEIIVKHMIYFYRAIFIERIIHFYTTRWLLIVLWNILFLVWIVTRRPLVASIVVKLIDTKKFVTSISLRRVKTSAYGPTKNISEDSSTMRFWVQVSELHVWYCVYCDNCFQGWYSWREVIRTSRGCSWGVIMWDKTDFMVAWFS